MRRISRNSYERQPRGKDGWGQVPIKDQSGCPEQRKIFIVTEVSKARRPVWTLKRVTTVCSM